MTKQLRVPTNPATRESNAELLAALKLAVNFDNSDEIVSPSERDRRRHIAFEAINRAEGRV